MTLEFQLEMHPRTAWDFEFTLNQMCNIRGDGLTWIDGVKVSFNYDLAIYQPKRIKYPDSRFVSYGREDDCWLEYFYPELVVPEIEAEIRVIPILRMVEIFRGCWTLQRTDINWTFVSYLNSEEQHKYLMCNSVSYRRAFATREMILDRIAKYFETA